jgi:hypothetical protein
VQKRWQKIAATLAIAITISVATVALLSSGSLQQAVLAQANPAPAPTPPAAGAFDQAAALAALREQIKGHENDPAPTVFKNIKYMTTVPAGRLLSIMEGGFSRSLGVDCTHCHVPGKWESEDKPEKQIARDMSDMTTKINKELLKNIKNLKSANPIINCTTCHRGQVKPATNLPNPILDKKSGE